MTRATFYLRQHMTKALSITLILGLLLSSLALNSGLSESLNTIAQALTTDGYWTDAGNYSIDWYTNYKDERGSESEPYLIESAEDLAGLAYLVNTGINNKPIDFEKKVIKLEIKENKIDLSKHFWESIGSFGKPFKGIFYGEGYAIEHMQIDINKDNSMQYNYTGFFGYVEGATIIGVNISSDSYIYTPGKSVGGICGYASNSKISNCSNSSNISTNNSSLSSVGGICGEADDSTIINCSNSGMIINTATTAALSGGICGLSYNSTITNCSNDGSTKDSKSLSKIKGSTGGICGYACKGTEISNCSNSGDIFTGVESKKSKKYKKYKIGGICGEVDDSTISNTYYEEGTVKIGATEIEQGIGNAESQTGTICLEERLMKAAAEEDDSLINKLNDWVDNYNSEEDIEIKALNWEIKDEYPVLRTDDNNVIIENDLDQ